MDNYNYLGWVPCLNGHLDFGLTKVLLRGGFTNSESKDLNVIDENYSVTDHHDSHQRRIVLQSWVDWRDSEKYPKDSGYFRIFVTAEVSGTSNMDARYLTGNVLIYPKGAEPDNYAKRSEMNVHTLSHDLVDTDDLHKKNDLFNKLNEIVKGSAPISLFKSLYFFASLRFTIAPNGLTWIGYNCTMNDPESQFVVARQIFYYLKYSIHMHKHHTDTQDSLTTIVSCGQPSEYRDAGLMLICQLKRELTNLNRIQNVDTRLHPTNDACGIISYVKSLIRSLREDKIIDDQTAEREVARFDYIKLSFDALNKKLDGSLAYVESSSNKIKLWLALLTAYFFGSAAFLVKPDPKPESLVNMQSEQVPFALGVVLLVAYFSFKQYYKRTPPKNNIILKDSGYAAYVIKLVIILACMPLVIYWNEVSEFLAGLRQK